MSIAVFKIYIVLDFVLAPTDLITLYSLCYGFVFVPTDLNRYCTMSMCLPRCRVSKLSVYIQSN